MRDTKAVHDETRRLSVIQSLSSVSEETVHDGDRSVSIVMRGCLCQHNLEASTLGVLVEMPDC